MKKTLLAGFAVLVLGVVLLGCASVTGRTAGELIDDSVIISEVNAKIIQEPELSYWKIDVGSKEGNVVLTGFVTTKAGEDRAIAVAKSVKGVKSVKSLLKVKPK